MNTNTQLFHNIALDYGTPTYIMQQDILEEAYLNLEKSFRIHWPNSQIAYSYKTNSLMQVCKLFHSLGAWAEVTSGLEYSMACRLSVQGHNIVFNGPYKSNEELQNAIINQSLINIDNFDELNRIEEIGTNNNLSDIEVGIRVVSSLNILSWDKFGFDVDTGEAELAAEKIRKSRLLKLVATHAHFRSNILNLKEYQRNLCTLTAFNKHIANKGLITMKYINIGSGIATSQPVLATADQWKPPSFDEYAKTAANCLIANGIPDDVTLVLEPGRCITSNAGLLLTRVVALKHRGDRNIAIVDAGINMVPGLPMYKYRIKTLSSAENPMQVYEIHGSLCEKLDVLGEALLGQIQIGDIIVIESVGAYDMAGRSFTFIRPKPQVVWVENNGNSRLVRRSENIEDLLNIQRWS